MAGNVKLHTRAIRDSEFNIADELGLVSAIYSGPMACDLILEEVSSNLVTAAVRRGATDVFEVNFETLKDEARHPAILAYGDAYLLHAKTE